MTMNSFFMLALVTATVPLHRIVAFVPSNNNNVLLRNHKSFWHVRSSGASATHNLSLVRADQDLEVLLEKSKIDEAIQYLQAQKEEDKQSSLSVSVASKLITLAATKEEDDSDSSSSRDDIPLVGENTKIIRDPIGGGEYTAKELVGSSDASSASTTGSRLVSPKQEQRLVQCYSLLKDRNIGGGDGNIQRENSEPSLFRKKDVRELVLPTGSGCSVEQLERFTELPIKSFRPNPNTARLYWFGAVVAVLMEIVIAQLIQISPQPLFGATFAALFVDQLLGGAYSEKIMWTVFPDMKDRVIRHEAGHLLVAHVLGCPIQSITLGAWDALTKEGNDGQQRFIGAGTSFFDPDLNAASIKGRITRSIVDRYSVILMAGIAAEALSFGDSEGGSDDEKSLTVFLSETVQVNQNIPEQARWAATNALSLLKENRDAYERLVMALQEMGSGNIGDIMMALEGYSDNTIGDRSVQSNNEVKLDFVS